MTVAAEIAVAACVPVTSPKSAPLKLVALVAVVALPVNGPLNEPVTVPVKVGLARLAFKSSAVCCAVDTGLLASLVLVTLPNPTIDAVTPDTVPVKVGLASGAFSPSLPSSLLIAERIVSVAEIEPVVEE